jgi:hypothetical protein
MADCIINSKVDFTCSIIAHGSEIENTKESNKMQFLLGERSHIRI